MKQIYMSVLLVMLFTVNVFGEQHASKFGESYHIYLIQTSPSNYPRQMLLSHHFLPVF